VGTSGACRAVLTNKEGENDVERAVRVDGDDADNVRHCRLRAGFASLSRCRNISKMLHRSALTRFATLAAGGCGAISPTEFE
jgi:hypothetical protein